MASTCGKGNGTCKGPEVKLCLVQRNTGEVSGSGVTEGESIGVGVRGQGDDKGRHAESLAFMLNEVEAREDSKQRRDMT